MPVWAFPNPMSLPPSSVVVLNQPSTENVCGPITWFCEVTSPVFPSKLVAVVPVNGPGYALGRS